jgi:HK97 family phage major capsid protein
MNPEQIRAAFAERMHAVSELRALADEANGRELTSEEAAKEARLNDAITKMDERIQNGLAVLEREAKADEARAALDRIAPAAPVAPAVESDIVRFAKGDVRSIEFAPEARDLTKGTNSAGGFTVPTSMYDRIVEHLIENSAILSAGATVLRTAGGENITVPKTAGYSSAAIVAEAGTIGESDPSFGQVTLEAYKYAFISQMSSELLSDSAFGVENFVVRQGGTALGNGIGAHLVTGTGSSQPNGVMTAASTGKTAASNAAITADELIDLYHSVVSGYRRNASWLMKDSTLAAVRKLKDTTNQYLWQPGLQAGAPDMLLGRPVVTDPNVAAIGTVAKSVAFGDFSGYFVRFAGPVRIERSVDFAFNTDLVSVRFILRGDGDLVDTNAVKVLVHLV